MGYPTKLLGDGETIAFEMRPHWRSLVLPVVWLVVVAFGGGFLLARSWDWTGAGGVIKWLLLVAILLGLAALVVKPFLVWWTTLYVFTNRRIIMRTGIIATKGQDMPLSKLNNVEFSHTVVERFLNCGTLHIASGNDEDLIISNVPNVEVVQREINRLHEEDDARRRTVYGPGATGAPVTPQPEGYQAFPPPAGPPVPPAAPGHG